MKIDTFLSPTLNGQVAKRVEEQQKLIFYTEEKVLLFWCEEGEFFTVPTRKQDKTMFYDAVVEDVIADPKHDMIEIYRKISYMAYNDLEVLRLVKHYYAAYLALTKKMEDKIIRLANDFSLSPMLLSIEELKQLQTGKDFDHGIFVSAKEIESKILMKNALIEARKNFYLSEKRS